MEMDDKFNRMLENKRLQAKKLQERINKFKNELNNLQKDSRAYELRSQHLRDTERDLIQINNIIEFMRPNDAKDEQSRLKILKEFPKIIKDIFPDGFPIVFHGTKNIGTVRQILKSGGLLMPEQRNESMTSFASAIDVTYKNNITVSCEFADAGSNTFLPYGAIFAFKPQEDEIERVISTGDNTEVPQGGVNGANFRNEPKRLFGIITTPENVERVKGWCEQYSIDPSKVLTHNAFIERYKELNASFML